MKAKELQLGDWVNTPKGNYQIDSIQDNDVVGTTYNNGDGVESLFDIDKVKPISLTVEILEKNGWSQVLYSNESYDNEDAEQLSLWTGEDDNEWWWHVGVELVTPLNYVHELQHALRLCGIEKEIVID